MPWRLVIVFRLQHGAPCAWRSGERCQGLAAVVNTALTSYSAARPFLPFVVGRDEPCEGGLGVAGDQVLSALLDPLVQRRREYRAPVLAGLAGHRVAGPIGLRHGTQDGHQVWCSEVVHRVVVVLAGVVGYADQQQPLRPSPSGS